MSDPTELPPLPMNYFHLILRRFASDPARRELVLSGIELDDGALQDPALEMSFAQQTRLSDNLSEAFGDGWILDVPEVWEPASQGALGMAVLSSATAGEAIATMAAYTSVLTPNYRVSAARKRDHMVLTHSLRLGYPDSQVWTVTASVFLAMSRMFQALLGAARSDVRYEFQRAEPRYSARLQALLGGPVRWRAGANAAIVPAPLLGVRSPMADATSHDMAVAVLERTRHARRSPEGVKARIEHLLAHAPSARLPVAAAARALGLSQRTLVRRLADVDARYRDLIDLELRARARRWLDAGVLSRREISERLGFADVTSFSRACRRWFGAPP